MKVLIGNIFDSKAKTLVNTVNCVGVMGKGVALDFKKKYPQMFQDYLQKCKKREIKPGQPYYYSDLLGTSIINFPTKDDWRSQSNISYIINGLDWFRKNYKQLGIDSVAFPPLGCGNGGLLWEDVGPIMYRALKPLPIYVEIYAPYGTKQEFLKEEFLSDYKGINQRIGQRAYKLSKPWLCILEVLYRLNENKFSNHVGRTIYQKLCYLLTIEGLQTGFKFEAGAYGPYSVQAKNAFQTFANAMLIEEKKIGPMSAVFTTPKYEKLREKNMSILQQNGEIISKVTDLFMRIKDTEQAELYATILYAYNDLVKTNKCISESDLFEYILKWKNRWRNVEKLKDIEEGIRDLNLLKYINVEFVPNFVQNYDL